MSHPKAGLFVLVLSLLIVGVGCQTTIVPARIPPDWHGRLGGGMWLTGIGEAPQPALTGAVGYRISPPWFVEIQVTYPRLQDVGTTEGDKTRICEGLLWIYTLNGGQEFYVSKDGTARARWQVGPGWFHSDGIGDDDNGFAATIGGSFQYLITTDFWAQIGLAYYGMYTDLDRIDHAWQHNALLEFSLVYDF